MRPPTDSPAPAARTADSPAAGGRHGLDVRFRRLFDLHGEEVFRFFLRKRFAVEDARDLTQTVFFRVYQGMKGFRGESTERTWVFSVAQNVFRNTLRHEGANKRQRSEIPYEGAGPGERPDGGAASLPDPAAPDPFETTLTRERQALLWRAIDELPPRMRQCVLLWVDQDLKYREIAQVLDVSIDTVKSQLHQAKERLRERLGDELHPWDELGGPS